jgi:hypothetical protein
MHASRKQAPSPRETPQHIELTLSDGEDALQLQDARNSQAANADAAAQMAPRWPAPGLLALQSNRHACASEAVATAEKYQPRAQVFFSHCGHHSKGLDKKVSTRVLRAVIRCDSAAPRSAIVGQLSRLYEAGAYCLCCRQFWNGPREWLSVQTNDRGGVYAEATSQTLTTEAWFCTQSARACRAHRVR